MKINGVPCEVSGSEEDGYTVTVGGIDITPLLDNGGYQLHFGKPIHYTALDYVADWMKELSGAEELTDKMAQPRGRDLMGRAV